jgi:hypothetical protein
VYGGSSSENGWSAINEKEKLYFVLATSLLLAILLLFLVPSLGSLLTFTDFGFVADVRIPTVFFVLVALLLLFGCTKHKKP